MPFQLTALPARTDNYIWLINNATHAWVIDPAEAQVVRDYIAQRNLILADILLTHHHHDHVGGIADLAQDVIGRIIGDSERIVGISQRLHAPCLFELSYSHLTVQMLATPGHTYDHVGYYVPQLMGTGVVFCGDTLFSAGCGRVFDGTVDALFDSVVQLMELPPQTQLACAHEYTAHNLKFALAIQNSHRATQAREYQVKCTRDNNLPSLPSALGIEFEVNPFCRAVAIAHGGDSDKQWRNGLTQLAQAMNHPFIAPHTNDDLNQQARAYFALCRALRNEF